MSSAIIALALVGIRLRSVVRSLLIALSVGCASAADKTIILDSWSSLLRLSIALRLSAISLRLSAISLRLMWSSILLLLLIR